MDVKTVVDFLLRGYIAEYGTGEDRKEAFRDMLEYPPEPYEVADWLFSNMREELASLVEKLAETERTARQSKMRSASRHLRSKYSALASELGLEQDLDFLIKRLVQGVKPDLRKKGDLRELFPQSPKRGQLNEAASEVKGTMTESLRVEALMKLGSSPEEISEVMADASTGAPEGIEKLKGMFEWLKAELRRREVAMRTYTVYLSNVRNWVRRELVKAGDLSEDEAKQILYKVNAYDPTSTKVVKEMQREVVENSREDTETRITALMEGEANPEGVAYVLGLAPEMESRLREGQKSAAEGFNVALFIALSVAMSSRPGEICDSAGKCLLGLTDYTPQCRPEGRECAEGGEQVLPIWAYEALAVTQKPELVAETKSKPGSKQLQFYRMQAPCSSRGGRYGNLKGVVGTLKTRKDSAEDPPEEQKKNVKPFLSGFPVKLVEEALKYWKTLAPEERRYAKQIGQNIIKDNYNGNLTDLRRAGARTAVDVALKYLREESPVMLKFAKENEGFLMQLALRHCLEVDLKAFEHYRV